MKSQQNRIELGTRPASPHASRRWLKVETHSAATSEPVHDIAFAPNLGRSYHVLAIASKELKIISMKPLGTPQQQMAKKADESQVWPLTRLFLLH